MPDVNKKAIKNELKLDDAQLQNDEDNVISQLHVQLDKHA